jgi:hypothetical protein
VAIFLETWIVTGRLMQPSANVTVNCSEDFRMEEEEESKKTWESGESKVRH